MMLMTAARRLRVVSGLAAGGAAGVRVMSACREGCYVNRGGGGRVAWTSASSRALRRRVPARTNRPHQLVLCHLDLGRRATPPPPPTHVMMPRSGQQPTASSNISGNASRPRPLARIRTWPTPPHRASCARSPPARRTPSRVQFPRVRAAAGAASMGVDAVTKAVRPRGRVGCHLRAVRQRRVLLARPGRAQVDRLTLATAEGDLVRLLAAEDEGQPLLRMMSTLAPLGTLLGPRAGGMDGSAAGSTQAFIAEEGRCVFACARAPARACVPSGTSVLPAMAAPPPSSPCFETLVGPSRRTEGSASTCCCTASPP